MGGQKIILGGHFPPLAPPPGAATDIRSLLSLHTFITYVHDRCEGKVDFFNQIVSDSLNLIMPIKTCIHNNDAPWMSDKLKRSIKNRQRALQSGNSIEFRYYRNVVNMERKKCKSSYYDCKMKNLKHVKPKNWWSAVKKISGMDTITKSDLLSNLQIDDLDNLSDIEVAKKINDKFLEPLQEFQPLQITVPNSDSISNVLTVSELDVWNCLNSLNPWKSGGPDNIPSWVFKEYAMILSLPVMKIINSSYTLKTNYPQFGRKQISSQSQR